MENPRLETSFVIPCNDLMVTLNYQGEIITFNPAFENAVGVKILPQIPFFFKDVVAPSFSKQVPLVFSQIINSPLTVFSFDIELVISNGEVQTFHWKSFTDPSRKQIFLMGSLLKDSAKHPEPEVWVSKGDKFLPQSINDNPAVSNLPPSQPRATYRESEKIEALITLDNETIIFWNAAAAALFELPPIQDKSLPRSLFQLFPDIQLNGIFSAELYAQLLAKASENGVVSFPWLFQTATGKVFSAEAVLIALTGFEYPRYQLLVMPGAQQTNQSLELKKAYEEIQAREEELRQNADELLAVNEQLNQLLLDIQAKEELLTSIIDNAPIAIYCKEYISDDFVFSIWNKEAENIFGIPKEKVIGRSLKEVFEAEIAQVRKAVDLEVIHNNKVIHIPDEKYKHPQAGQLIFDTTRVPMRSQASQKALLLGISRNVTQERLAETNLREARIRLQDALHLANLGTWEFDLQKGVLILDKLHLQWMGLAEEQTEPFTIAFAEFVQTFVHPEDVVILNEATQRAISAQDLQFAEKIVYRLIDKQGKERYILVTIRILKNDEGITTHGYGNSQDITEQYLLEKTNQARAERKARQEEALNILAKNELITQGNTEAALRLITETLAKTLLVARSSLWVLDENQTQITALDLYEALEDRHSSGIELFREHFPTYFEGLAYEKTIAAQNAHTHPFTREFSEVYLTPLKINSMLDTPIRRGGKMIGVICNEHIGPFREWHEDEEAFCVLVANLISVVFETEEKVKALQNLQEKDLYLSAALEAAGLATWEYDCNRQTLKVDDRYWGFLGYQEPPSLNPNLDELIFSFCATEYKAPLETVFREALSTTAPDYRATLEYKITPKDTDYRYLLLTMQAIVEDSGNLQRLYGTFQDITERKQEEIKRLALFSQKQKFDASLTQLARQETLAGNFSLEQALYRILEELAQTLEIQRASIWNVVDDEDPYLGCQLVFDQANRDDNELPPLIRANQLPSLWNSLCSGELLNIKYARYDARTKELNDSYFSVLGITSVVSLPIYRNAKWTGVLWLEHTGIVRQFGEAEISYALSITDFIALTYEAYERNLLLKQLAENETKLSEALRIANLSRWEYDLEKNLITVDRRYLEIHGLPVANAPTATDSPEVLVFPYVHPEDMERMQFALNQAGGALDSHYSDSLEYRIIQAGGEIRYIDLSIRVQHNPWGRVEKIFGTGQDITARKKKEMEERQADLRKQKYSQTLAELAKTELVNENTSDLLPVLSQYLQKITQTIGYSQVALWTAEGNSFTCLMVLEKSGASDSKPAYFINEQNCPYACALLQNPQAYNFCSGENTVAFTELMELHLLNDANFEMRFIPIFRAYRLIGYISCAYNPEEHIAYPEDADFLTTITDIIATSYETYERYRLLKQLAEKEIRLSDAMNIAGLSTWQLEAENGVVVGDEKTWLTFGITPDKLDAISFEYQNLVERFFHAEDKNNALSFFQKALGASTELYEQAEFRILPLDYDLRYVLLSFRCTFDPATGIKNIFGVQQDITARKNAEMQEKQMAQRKEKFNVALSHLSMLEANDEDLLETLFTELTQVAAKTLETQRVGVWFFNEGLDELFCACSYNALSESFDNGQEWNATEYPVLFSYLAQGQAQNIKFARYNEITKELTPNYLLSDNVVSMAITPIWRGRKLMGCLIAEQLDIIRSFLPDEQNFLAALADIVVVTIERHEKTQALQLLAEKEIKLQDAMKIANLCTWELNPQSLEITVDNRWLAMHGLTAEEVGGFTIYYPDILNEVYLPEDARLILGKIKQIQEQPELAFFDTFEFKIQPKNDSARYILFSLRVIEDALGNKKVIGTGQDITRRKLDELQKAKTQARKLKFEETLSTLAKNEALAEGDWKTALQKITAASAQTLNVSYAGVFMYEENNSALVCQMAFNSLDSHFFIFPTLKAEAAPIFFAAAAELQELPISSLENEALFAELYPERFAPRQIQSLLWLPIYRAAQKIGYLAFENTFSHNWEIDEIEFGYSLTDLITLAWEAFERKLAMERLAQKEEELRKLVVEKSEALDRLQNAQQQLIQSEKMASLGQLIAGIAHEVNTPISAVKASARNIIRALPIVLNDVPLLLKSLSDEDTELFMKMVNQSTSANFELTTQEERKYRTEVKKVLDEYDIEDAYELAKELVEVRLIHNIEDYVPLFEHDSSHELLDKAYKLGQFKKNLDNIELAAEKTARVVMALKSYSHVQQADRFIPVFLHENIETILTIYQNQLKYGIAVERQFEEFEPVPVYPDEIGQVWTNIISNAIHAMKGKGKLIISVSKQAPWAVVSITDNGPGIPPEISNRIFEPFFTTKPQGEGTGLGLDICKKIVEKHNGTIEVDTEPGRTTFTVKVPLVQPETHDENAN